MRDNYLHEIKRNLFDVIVRENRRDALKGFYLFISFFCGWIILLCLIESVGKFEILIRTVLFFCFVIVSAVLLVWLVVLPFLKSFSFISKPDFWQTAETVGNNLTDIKDELLNALQLVSVDQSNYSPQLVNAAFERIYNRTKNYEFRSIVKFGTIRKYFRIAVTILAFTFILFLTFPGLASAAYHLMNYNKNFVPPSKFVFDIQPGNAEITKGENVTIRVRAIGEMPSEIFLLTKSEEQSEFTEKKLLSDSLGNFIFEATAIKNSFEYFASAEKIVSETYKISVINRPIITDFQLTIFPPAYSRLPEQTQKDNGNIIALPGSKINIILNSSRELSTADLFFSDSTNKKMKIVSSKASIEFSVSKEINYQILIGDTQNHTNANPINYSIKMLVDEAPSIEMISPNQNIKLGNESKISLISKITDDYGFSKMNLSYRLAASKYRQATDEFSQIPLTISNQLKEDEVYFVWDLAPLVLAEGEALSYFLEIYDNDNITGPKSARTQQFTITVPSLDELFADAENKQEDAAKDLAETLEEAEKLKQEMQKISDDLKQNSKEISWQEKERIVKAAEKFREIGNKVDEISQKLSDMKNDLADNNLLSEETLQKYNELQKLLEEIGSEEMKEAFKRLQDALQSMIRDNVQMSLEELKANEEYIKKSLERTLNLLKRIQIEMKGDELIKRTEDLSKKIEELKNKTEKTNLSDQQKRDELSKRQNDVTEDLNDLKEEMQKLDEKMSELKEMPKDQLEKAMTEFDKQNNQELSKEALNELRKMQKLQAMQNQQQLSSNMQSMNKQFKDLQSAMQQLNQMKTFYDMIKILDDLLALSKNQEKLKNTTEQLSPYSLEFTKNAREQSEIQSNLGKVLQKMSDLSQKTFAITPEMGRALGKALSDMQQSITAMQNQQGPMASQKQKEAMASLNEAASLMKSGMEQLLSGGQGGGMMSLMQQLQQLSQQQMNLNQLTQMLNQGQLTQEMMAQMQRLAQQQELIRKSLEQLNQEAKEAGQSKRLAANLEKILNEMKEVVTNLQSQKLNDELVKQQEKILSRLLDAQRSINERDFEKDRKSDTGKNVLRISPPDLILSTEEGKNKLKDELMKAIREGYKKDYEDLIRKYFEALQTPSPNPLPKVERN